MQHVGPECVFGGICSLPHVSSVPHGHTISRQPQVPLEVMGIRLLIDMVTSSLESLSPAGGMKLLASLSNFLLLNLIHVIEALSLNSEQETL